jgi:hypothetical protein
MTFDASAAVRIQLLTANEVQHARSRPHVVVAVVSEIGVRSKQSRRI